MRGASYRFICLLERERERERERVPSLLLITWFIYSLSKMVKEDPSSLNTRSPRRMAPASCWRHSNLRSFLDRTTPMVRSHSLPKTCFRDLNNLWQPIEHDMIKYFTLGDLWDQYYEWSVCGAGVPILLDSGETVEQYYVPYLSAIQIYTSKSLARNAGEESESDAWSDDSESEKLSRSSDGASEDSAFEQDALCPTREQIGHLYFQYIERCAPYGRVPLINKVYELAQDYPGLTSYKSVELSPASWMSVAWYPIYHIPTQRNVKDLSACFLTYHTISSSFQDNAFGDEEKGICCSVSTKDGRKFKKITNCVSLPPLGLATYKMHGNVWINPGTEDHETIIRLYSAAGSWLKQHSFQHHDFNFFLSRSL